MNILYITYFLLLNVFLITKEKENTLISEKDYLLGKFDPSKHPDFASVPLTFSPKKDLFLRKEALAAFVRMHAAAKKDGVQLSIISAARNFERQKDIWERKWLAQKNEPKAMSRAYKILEYSAMPGTSRHHWGTDIDINSVEDAYFLKGKGKKEYDWLVKNAEQYGFLQPYIAGRATGYKEEKWHWTYLPLSQPFLSVYEKQITDKDVASLPFKGASTATEIKVVEKYVFGINYKCK